MIHCSAGVQWGDTSDKAWTHYAIPAGLYTAEEIAAASPAFAAGEGQAVFLLRLGSRGSDVIKLQTALNALGYDCGAADGIFGVKTEAAVRRFQRAQQLAVDGVAGRMTWAAIERALA